MEKILILLAVLFCFSCKKPEDRICLKGVGEEHTSTILIDENIDSLFLHGNIFYTIVPSDANKIELKGGKNLLPFIQIENHYKKLVVSNQNRCNFLRTYKQKIYADIYVDSITFIDYFGSAKLTNIDTLRSGEFRLFVSEGSGDVDLTLVNGYTAATVANGYGSFILKGSTSIGFFHCNSNSYCDARDFLVKDRLHVTSNTVSSMYINAEKTLLSVDIFKSGKIGYVGNPTSIKVNKKGNGTIYPLD